MNQAMAHDIRTPGQGRSYMLRPGSQADQPRAGTGRRLCRHDAGATKATITRHHQHMAKLPFVGIQRPLRKPIPAPGPGLQTCQRLAGIALQLLLHAQGFKHYPPANTGTCTGKQPGLGADKRDRNRGTNHLAFSRTRRSIQAGRQIHCQHRHPGLV